MKLTKFGHSCLLIEEKDARILFDPGMYSAGFEDLAGIDLILITHEHSDHLEMPTLQALLARNHSARVITAPAVRDILQKEGIAAEVMSDGEAMEVKGVSVEAYGAKHAEIYKTMPLADNIGFFIGGRFFYPGDSFTVPPKPVEILGLPTFAPWMRISEGMDYAEKVKPKIAIPMHDGIVKQIGLAHFLPTAVLPTFGIQFLVLEPGIAQEF